MVFIVMETVLVSSLEKVGLEKGWKPLKEDVPLSVLFGETISFQIAFRESNVGTDSRIHLVSVDKEIYGGGGSGEENGILPSEENPEIRIRQVLPVMCRRSCNPDSVDEDYLFNDARMAPDLLRDVDEGMIPVTEEWQSLWVDVCPRKGQKPGLYRLEIRFKIGRAHV